MFQFLSSIPIDPIESITTISGIKATIAHTIQTNQFFQGGMIVAIAVAIGAMLKPVPQAIWNSIKRLVVFQVRINENDELYYYFEQYLYQNHESKYRNVEASVILKRTQNSGPSDGNIKIDTDETVFFKQCQDAFLLRRSIHYILINKTRDKLENASSGYTRFNSEFVISGWFCKQTIQDFVIEVQQTVLAQKIEKEKTSVNVFTNTVWGEWLNEASVKPKNLNQIFVEGMENVIHDIQDFLDNESWYTERNIMWKRGLMFHGAPGNGKTALLLAISKYFKKTIFFINLNGMNDTNLRRVYREVRDNSIVVFEDVDSIFVKRENQDQIEFSFSTLLNCIDGAFSKHGVISIFTTNHPEKLDPALLRGGRIDYKHEFKNPSVDLMCKYLNMFYNAFVTADMFESYECKLPMVEIQNTCLENISDISKCISEILRKDKTGDIAFFDRVALEENDKLHQKKVEIQMPEKIH